MTKLGLTERYIREATQYNSLYIGRVISQSKDLYKVATESGELKAEVSGKLRYHAAVFTDVPAVGDFVLVDREDDLNGVGIVHHVLTRKSLLIRKMPGSEYEGQVIAANIDMVFICMALNNDFNLRRLERYLAIVWDSGALPVVVLTKADLCADIEARLAEVTDVAIGVDVLVTNSLAQEGYLTLKRYITEGQTIAFIGSSGVGKSTLINRLLDNDLLATGSIRKDDKGRHTTTRRELIVLPGGGIVIDTPGMRELGIFGSDTAGSFADIEELAASCKFRDCSHTNEPNCAVQDAISKGAIAPERLASYKKLQKEAKYDGLTSKSIEKEKINHMFRDVGGMKNARKLIKAKKKQKERA